MIAIDLGNLEYYDDDLRQFVYEEGGVVRFEYSLKVLYNWESKWRKPFLKGQVTHEEMVDFYMMMAMDPIEEKFLSEEAMTMLSRYISDSNTATTFTTLAEDSKGNKTINKGKTHTSEELYAIMFANNIPIEFENRNLNRLLIILKIMATQNQPPKNMSKQDVLKQNASLNAQRKAEMKTKG